MPRVGHQTVGRLDHLTVRMCLSCGRRAADLQTSANVPLFVCPSCGADLYARPPRSYAEMEGLNDAGFDPYGRFASKERRPRTDRTTVRSQASRWRARAGAAGIALVRAVLVVLIVAVLASTVLLVQRLKHGG